VGSKQRQKKGKDCPVSLQKHSSRKGKKNGKPIELGDYDCLRNYPKVASRPSAVGVKQQTVSERRGGGGSRGSCKATSAAAGNASELGGAARSDEENKEGEKEVTKRRKTPSFFVWQTPPASGIPTPSEVAGRWMSTGARPPPGYPSRSPCTKACREVPGDPDDRRNTEGRGDWDL